jgi:SAM-dependent methyltransferase
MSAAETTREFYERYVAEHVPYHRSPRGPKRLILKFLPYWSYREWRFWERTVPRGARVLDLGCARGREVFRERAAFVVGVDMAQNALGECAAHYDGALAGSLTALPAADESFDCVVSSHVMGHVPVEEKDQVLSEIRRVLRPGGKSLHVVETDSRGWLMNLAKEEPALYQRYLIEQDGHVGLELPSQAVARFERAGLAVEEVETLADSDVHPRLALKWFGGEYRQISRQLGRLVARSEALLGSPLRLAWEEIRLGRRGRRWERAEVEEGLDEALFVSIVTRKPRAAR